MQSVHLYLLIKRMEEHRIYCCGTLPGSFDGIRGVIARRAPEGEASEARDQTTNPLKILKDDTETQIWAIDGDSVSQYHRISQVGQDLGDDFIVSEFPNLIDQFL